MHIISSYSKFNRFIVTNRYKARHRDELGSLNYIRKREPFNLCSYQSTTGEREKAREFISFEEACKFAEKYVENYWLRIDEDSKMQKIKDGVYKIFWQESDHFHLFEVKGES